MPVFDVDNDHLEQVWKKPVSKALTELGDEGFVVAEGEACKLINKTNTIISLTGSVPLNSEGFAYLRKNGLAVFLDVDHAEIVRRCAIMKVDRIVGQATQSLSEILSYRSSVYNSNYDLRILVEVGANVQRVTDMVLDQLNKDQHFVSTRSGRTNEDFCEVVTKGLAKDRGLFFPCFVPAVTLRQLERLLPLDYAARCLRLMEMFPLAAISPKQLQAILEHAYQNWPTKDVLPLNHINHGLYELELFHGPTASFKDFALQVLPSLFQACAQVVSRETGSDSPTTYLFVVATSGDTGSACLQGFGSAANTPVVVLYPKGGVSPIQEAQMLAVKGDVCVIAVEGDFDYCQTLVKDLFNNQEFCSLVWNKYKGKLASGNSINWGRLFPQIPFAFHAYLELVKSGRVKMGERIDVCVPTGNYGNVLGVILAKKMGLPIDQIIVASNSNDVLTEFLTTGVFDLRKRELMKTVSPSIDILLPSNLERFLYLISGENSKVVAQWFSDLANHKHFTVPMELLRAAGIKGSSCSEADTLTTIGQVYQETGHILDPHTAVAYAVATRFAGEKNPMVIAGTAHYLKFPGAVAKALRLPLAEDCPMAQQVAALRSLTSQTPPHAALASLTARTPEKVCAAKAQAIQNTILAFLDSRRQ